MAYKVLRVTKTASKTLTSPCQARVNLLRHSSGLTSLNNGVCVVSENTGNPNVTVGLRVEVGSRYESAAQNGVTSVIEKLIFQGGKRGAGGLGSEVEQLGGSMTASLTRDHLLVQLSCPSKQVTAGVNLLGELVSGFNTDAQSLSLAKQQALAQLEAAGSDMEVVTNDYMHMAAFHGNSLAQSPLGTTASIKGLTSQAVQGFKAANFVPGSMTLACVGGAAHVDVVKAAESAIQGQGSRHGSPVTPRFQGGEVKMRDDSMGLAYISMAVHSPPRVDPRNIALAVASRMLGTFDRSHASPFSNNPLQETAAAMKMPLYRPLHIQYADTGLWGVYAAIQGDHLQYWVEGATGAFQYLWQESPLSHVERVQRQMIRELEASRANMRQHCATLAHDAVAFGRVIDKAERMRRIKTVTPSDVQKAADDALNNQEIVVGAAGAVEQLMDFTRVRGRMWNVLY